MTIESFMREFQANFQAVVGISIMVAIVIIPTFIHGNIMIKNFQNQEWKRNPIKFTMHTLSTLFFMVMILGMLILFIRS